MKNQKGIESIFLTAAVMILLLGGLGYFAFRNGRIRQNPARQIFTAPTPIPAEDFCELNKEYESSSADPVDCVCPKGSTKKFEITGWDKCPVEGMTDCPKATFKCLEDETGNWKTYTNYKYGFKTKYYPDSPPNEIVGNNEVGQFTYLFKVNFGTNPIKFPYGYELSVRLPRSLDDYKTELVGHITDQVDSVETAEINGTVWTKIGYRMFLTTDYVPVTMAYSNKGKYNYTITTPTAGIDQILSIFKYLITDEEALKKVYNLDEVQQYLNRVKNGHVDTDQKEPENGVWTIHVYEINESGLTATYNWFKVNIESGEITKEFDY